MVAHNEIAEFNKLICNDDFIASLNLIERDKAILQMRCLYKHSFGFIGKQFNISNEMARVIYNRTINRLSQYTNTINKQVIKEPNSEGIKLKGRKKGQIPIFNLAELSEMCKKELKYKNIETLQELTTFSAKDILSFRGFGNKMLKEIESVLTIYGLSLTK